MAMRSAKMAQRWDHIPCNAFILATCIAEACSGDSLSAKNRALSPRAANKDIGSRGWSAPDRVFHSWNHSSTHLGVVGRGVLQSSEDPTRLGSFLTPKLVP
jgi:hypothetical protein